MSYESERKELITWMRNANEKYYADSEKEIKRNGISRDSEAGRQFQADIMEYNNKLLALKKKYGVD